MANKFSRKISVAPMMDWTDRHCRHFLRIISKHTLLYTEMINAKALVYGKALHLLKFNSSEHPLALQLGGNEPDILARAAKLGEEFGYDEINLNVGCPSDRVKSGFFGACLMLNPELVRNCVKAMAAAVNIPVTVKCRIGIDRNESYDFLKQFVETVSNGGCRAFIIHARNAWLNGLSPKENRNIPPLRYDLVYQLKQEFPHLEIIINGGIKTYEEIDQHMQYVDGVMLGREAYHNPYVLSAIDSRYFDDDSNTLSREEIIQELLPYVQNELSQGVFLKKISRHILGLFHGQAGARVWRRYLSDHGINKDAKSDVIETAYQDVLMSISSE